MDTHYSKFKVVFHLNNGERKEVEFYESLNDINYEKLVEIEENRQVSLKFQCKDEKAKLYMDGLELFPLNSFQSEAITFEGNEVYVTPSENELPLYKGGVCPLIPGIYGISVVLDRRTYYSLFRVTNKMLTYDEANEVRKELEEEIEGISFEFIKKRFSVLDKDLLSELPKNLYKFFVIANEFPNIMNSLMELRVRPNYKISNNYKIIEEEKVRHIDNFTLRNYLNNSVKPGFMKAPIKNIEYDLPENRWVKKIVSEILKLLNDFSIEIESIASNKLKKIEEIKSYLKDNESNIELNKESNALKYINELKIKAVKMKSSINVLKSTEWYSMVRNNIVYNVPHVLIQDSRYNILYRVYEKLHSKELNFEDDDTISLQWKRTDRLYEMWCYIKICKIIKDELGYEEVKGEIYSSRKSKKRSIIQDLESGTVGEFQKGEVRIKLYYDSIIPRYSSKTDFNKNPIFIKSSNNRPDGRLDVYKNDIYLGSIIFEFKYRTREIIWREDFYNHMDDGVVKQLMAYGTNCASIYMLRKETESKGKKIPIVPVRNVIVLYPESKSEYLNVDEVEDHNLKFIKVKPKKNLEILKEELEEEIDDLLENEKFRSLVK